MRSLDRVLTGILTGTLVLGSLNVPTALAAGPAASDQGKLKEAEQLYKQGKTRFETADYEEALSLWKQAYALLPDTEDAHVIRNALVYNISEAEIKAYEISRNVTHLRKAKLLLEDYLASHRQLYGDDAKATKERSEASERVRQVEKMIAEAEARGEKATPIAGGGEGDTTPTEPVPPVTTPPEGEQAKEPEEEQEQLSPEEQAKRDREEQIKADPVLKAQYEKATGQMVGGIVMAGIGVILLAVGGLSAVAWSNCTTSLTGSVEGTDSCRRVWGTIALATGIPGLGLAAGGGAMLGIGAKRRSALKDPEKPLPGTSPAPAAAIGPLFLRDGGGAAVTVRF